VGNNPVNWVDPWGLKSIYSYGFYDCNSSTGECTFNRDRYLTYLKIQKFLKNFKNAKSVVEQLFEVIDPGTFLLVPGVVKGPKPGGQWLSPKEWANSVANDILKHCKRSGIGTGARSGQHGRPYAAAARKLLEIAKDKGLLPEVRDQLYKKAKEFLSQAKGIRHK
jgi:hypothetical protein